MSVVSQSIPNLINGISQQNPVQRNVGQAESQVNFQSNIIDGLSKRPPTEFVKNLLASTVFPNNCAIHWINRDSNNQYVAVFTNGAVKVYDLAGNEKTVTMGTGASTYLTTTNPLENLNFVNIADYTFVANKAITVAEDSTTTAAKVQEFLCYVKSSQYGRQYSVKLNHSTWTYPIEVLFQMPTGNDAATDSKFRDTEKIAHILLYGTGSAHWNGSADGIGFKTIRTDTGATLSTSQGLANYAGITGTFTPTQFGNTIYMTCSSGTFTVETTDGFGNQAMYAIKDSINDFADLPYYAKTDMILQITGDEGDTLSDYYVKFTGNGVWSETVGAGVKVGLDDSTMPFALINNNDGTFSMNKQTYTNRVCGDEDTNSAPSCVGQVINNLTFFQNRLGIISNQNLILSENAEYYNFYATTGTDVLDTDPIDIAAAGTTVNKLYNSIDFNEQLLLFSEESQYILESIGESVTPTTATLTKTSQFNHALKVAPKSAGKFVYFAQRRNDKTAVTEYFADDDTLTNDGIDVTIGVQKLIPDNAFKLIANNVEDTLFVLTHDTLDAVNNTAYTPGSAVTSTNANTLNVYKYFFDADKKVQSSWSTWTLNNCQILSAEAFDANLYLVVNENKNTKLLKIDLRNPSYGSLTHNLHMDFRTSALTGTYNSTTDLTTFTMPYSVNQTLRAVDTTNGTNHTITDAANATCTITVTDALNIAVGTTLTFTDNNGVSTTMTGTATNPTTNPNEFSVGVDAASTADNIAVGAGGVLGINNLAGYSAPNPASNVITVTRAVAGASNLTVTSSDPVRLAVTNFVTPATTYTLVGNHTSCVFGSFYDSTYQFSTPYIRETLPTGGIMSVTSGRYQIRQFEVNYEDTGFFQAEVTPDGRATTTYDMSGTVINSSGAVIGQPNIDSGTYKIPIQSKNTGFTCSLKNNSHLPCHFVSAEIEGFYFRRSNRI